MRNHRQNWLDIFLGFRVALDAKKILLGMLGVYFAVVVALGLLVIAYQLWPGQVPSVDSILIHPSSALPAAAKLGWAKLTSTLTRLQQEPGAGLGIGKLAFGIGSCVLMLAIWSAFGGAIARSAAVDFAKDERLSISAAFSFAANKFGAFFWSPVVPLIFILVLLCCNALLGLVGRIPAVGPVIVGLFFWLPALSSFLIVLLLIVSVFGLIYMWPTIAMEGTDTFDAVSRGFNYLFARPWKTLWCCLVAWAYGATCIAFVVGFTWLLLKIALHSVAFGMGAKGGALLCNMWTWGAGAERGLGAAIGLILVRMLFIIIWAAVLGFWASFKLTAMTIIYAVIRRDVDGTDMSEIYLPEPEAEESPQVSTPEQESPQEQPKE